MDNHVVHALSPAPQFVGREAELDALRAWWDSRAGGVIALLGLGGAGKTAIACRFVDEVTRLDQTLRPEGLFVWSFYQEPDVGQFLEQAHRYLSGDAGTRPMARGAGLLHLLRDSLQSRGRCLLVLDGLERVQGEESSHGGRFGQIEDPLLRGLLIRIAEGIGAATALVTSRFPLTDLDSLKPRGYRDLEIKGLSDPAALSLLRHHGVQGDDQTLARLVEAYGAHALTLDHLGSLIGHFLDGDPRRAPETVDLSAPGQDRQALRLARLLQAYETHLPPAELALLGRLCLLQRSITVEQIQHLFLCTPAPRGSTARELESTIQRMPMPEFLAEGFAGALGASVREIVIDALSQSAIAGPEEAFRQSITQTVAELHKQPEPSLEDEIEELSHCYGSVGAGLPTVERPLDADEQQRLLSLITRYHKLRRHRLLPYAEPPHALEVAFLKEGWSKFEFDPEGHEDVTPADVALALRGVKATLRRLAFQHRALLRVHRQCRLFQRKWRESGSLATLEAGQIEDVLSSLIARHLVVRESNDSVSVHPAVRDYFGRLASASERGFWHHLIGQQLIRLIARPGVRHPEDPASLDLGEEAIAHALAAGEAEKAWQIYTQFLGGHRQLAWKLGEMARGLRIVQGFTPCPDRTALGWYLRALGELDEAMDQNRLPYFRADVRLLQGRLPQVDQEGDPARSAIAEVLMGRSTQLPPEPLGCAIPRVQVLLYLGRRADAWHSLQSVELFASIGWADEGARCQLYRAELASRMGDQAAAEQALKAASRWVLTSGSVEHLCLFHLVRARAAMNEGDTRAARLAIDEGLSLAAHCGLRLSHVDLLCLSAGMALKDSQPSEAEQAARTAVKIASAADCEFQWGAAKAGHLLGRALLAQERREDARQVLEKVCTLRERIGDPRITRTRGLLKEIAG
jgi:hypothetical protein